jgi:hypothetical protein
MRLRLQFLALVMALAFTGCSKSTDQTQTGEEPAASGETATTGAASKSYGSKASAGKPVLVPVGTALTIRLGSTLSSKTSQSGEAFQGTLTQAVSVDGAEAIPAGSNATGEVVEAHPLGRFKGGASLAVRLTSIEVKGKTYAVSTSMVDREVKGKGKRTAIMAGGGAAVGALIGGLAGGGKGAAIGALAGGGAGTAGAAFTGNKDIILPAESALSFKLKDALELK